MCLLPLGLRVSFEVLWSVSKKTRNLMGQACLKMRKNKSSCPRPQHLNWSASLFSL